MLTVSEGCVIIHNMIVKMVQIEAVCVDDDEDVISEFYKDYQEGLCKYEDNDGNAPGQNGDACVNLGAVIDTGYFIESIMVQEFLISSMIGFAKFKHELVVLRVGFEVLMRDAFFSVHRPSAQRRAAFVVRRRRERGRYTRPL